MRVFLHQIPLVHHQHDALVVAGAQTKNVKILGIKTLRGVGHHDTDIGVFNGTHGAHHGVKLQTLLYLALFAQSGGIDEVKVETEALVTGENSISCRTRQRGHNVTVFAKERIDNGRLTHIRLTHDGDTREVVGQVVFILGEVFHHFVEQLARTTTGDGGNGIDFPNTQCIELRVIQIVTRTINLVHR